VAQVVVLEEMDGLVVEEEVVVPQEYLILMQVDTLSLLVAVVEEVVVH
jgi:hypothetical protein